MAKNLTEDAVRDLARDILGLVDSDAARAGVGQLTTFNQLGFAGVADKPDGWYLPNNKAEVALVLETKATRIALGKAQVDEVLKNVRIVQTQYEKVVGVLYNGEDVRVFKGEEEVKTPDKLQHVGYYLSLYTVDSIDKETNSQTSKNNIKDAVKMAFEGKPRPICAIDCFSPTDNSNLFIIPGHMDLSEYDPALSLALNSNNAITTLQNLPGAFYELIRLCCEKYKIDYVLIDMNPGLSAINQTFFMISDGFIVPTNPDPFSVMSLKTLKNVLPRWKNWAVHSREAFADSAYPLPESSMKFIGEIIQRFNLRNQRAARPYQGKIQEIKDYIEGELCGTLEKNDMLFDNSTLKSEGILTDHCLAEISEFGALIQKANAASRPVFALTPAQLEATGTVLDSMIVSQQRFNTEFNRIAKVILELVK